MMIPPSSSAEILQAMGQSRPIAPKGMATMLVVCIHLHIALYVCLVRMCYRMREKLRVYDVVIN